MLPVNHLTTTLLGSSSGHMWHAVADAVAQEPTQLHVRVIASVPIHPALLSPLVGNGTVNNCSRKSSAAGLSSASILDQPEVAEINYDHSSHNVDQLCSLLDVILINIVACLLQVTVPMMHVQSPANPFLRNFKRQLSAACL